jgi:hypothetical protein
MPVKLGKNAALKLGTEDVARISNMSLTINNQTVDISAIGDDFQKFASPINDWTATCTLQYDLSDTEQNTLHSRALSGGDINNIRFYVDSTAYYAPDTATDSEATCFIESYSWTLDNSSVVTADLSIRGSGPLAYTTV